MRDKTALFKATSLLKKKKDELIDNANFNIYQTSGRNKFLMQNNYFGLKN